MGQLGTDAGTGTGTATGSATGTQGAATDPQLNAVVLQRVDFAPDLMILRVGDPVHLSPRFTGMFTLGQVPADSHLVFVGTGTGLAPYMSMIRTHVETVRDRKVLVVHGARNSWDLGYRTELFYLQRYAPNFSYVPVLDHPQDEVVPWAGRVGYAQDLWREGVVGRTWGFEPTPDNCHVFLCGNPLMISAMKDVLLDQGFVLHKRKVPGQVHVEEF